MAKQIEFEGTVHEFPDDFTDADIAKALKASVPSSETKPRTTGSIPGDLLAGLGASVLQLPIGAYDLVRKVSPLSLPAPSEYIQGLGKPPETTAGKVGEFGGMAAQFMVPGGAVTKGVRALEAAGAGRLATTLARGLGEAATAGGVEAVRSGGDVGATGRAAATGGVFGAGTEAVSPAVAKLATAFLGKSTGAGAETIKTALSATSPRFKDAMRNKITEMEIVQDVRDAVERVVENRSQAYRQAFGQLDQNIRLNNAPTMKTILAELPNFKVGIDPKTLKLTFTNSRLASSASAPDRELMQEGVDMVRNWSDFSPAGMDNLKQAMYDLSKKADPRVEPFFLRVADSLKQNLNNNVPGYQKLTKDYADASEMLNMVRRELSTNAPNPGTMIRKLSYALNQHNSFRKLVLEMLDNAAGSDIKETMAGYALRDPMARGLAGVAQGVSAGFGGIPTLLRSVALGSPRAVGETLAFLSALKRSGIPRPPSLTPLAPAIGAQIAPPPQ